MNYKKLMRVIVIGIMVLTLTGCSSNTTKKVSNKTSQLPRSARQSDWNLKIVNVKHTVSARFTPTLSTVDNSQQLDSRVVTSYNELRAAAKKAGATLVGGSGYRSYEHQESVVNRNIAENEAKGMSAAAAKKETLKTVNPAGSSEHQTGLAMDFVTPSENAAGSDVTQEFATTVQGKWLKQNSWKYGWILRYPKNGKSSTYIDYESWHFRYVGKANAKYMHEHNLTLEQYVAKLPK